MYHALTSRLAGRRALLIIPLLSFIVLVVFNVYPRKPAIAFEIDPALWADGGPQPVEIEPTFPDPPPSSKAWGAAVPNIVHYVLFAKPDGTSAMDYRQYLAIRSTLVVQRPAATYLHYDILPTGPWWEALEPQILKNQVVAPRSVWDSDIALAAHKSDIIRLYALNVMGGVYLDLDVFVLRPLDELFYEPFTMGLEEENYSKMGNAVVISAPGAPFIDRWMLGYQDFRPWIYEYNGVIKPLMIAKAHPEELRLLNATAFLYPQWWLLDEVFTSTDFDFDTHPGYTYHAWGSLHQHLKGLNPRKVLDVETSFHRLLRRYMGEDDVKIWDSHVEGR